MKHWSKTKVFLTVSIVLNLFAISIAGGFFYKVKERSDFFMEQRTAELTPEQKKKVKKAFKEQDMKLLKEARKMHKVQKELMSVISSEDFDKDEFVKLATKLQEQKHELVLKRLELMGEVAQHLTAKERTALVHRFLKKEHRGGRRAGDKKDRQQPPRLPPQGLDPVSE